MKINMRSYILAFCYDLNVNVFYDNLSFT